MPRFSKSELEKEFVAYQQRGLDAASTHDWNLWADQFTEDARYVEHLYGEFAGREAIRPWITKTMTTFPGSRMPTFPIQWHVVDEDRGWIVCEISNRMEDPGDGSIHEALNLTVLHYAGDGEWSYEEDVYNPAHFMTMIRGWCRRAEELGNLPEDARSWLAVVDRRG
ncbi:MAG: nuclear transport factor 2 family protein [Actinomycetota bacterium]